MHRFRLRLCLISAWVLLLWVILCANLHPSVADPMPIRVPNDLYNVLGVPKKANLDELAEAYKKRMKRLPRDGSCHFGPLPASDDTCRLGLTLAYTLLSNPGLRSQYDQGKPLEVEIPKEQREDVAKLLEPLDKPKATRAREFGRVSMEAAGSIPVFYLAMTMNTYGKCLYTGDPLYCKAFLKSLKEPSGYVGFGAFALGAHYGGKGIAKVFGGGAKAQMASGFGGLAVGSLLNSVVSDYAHMPESKEFFDLKLWNAYALDDPKVKAKKDELMGKMWAKTFGDPNWWMEKGPEVFTLGASAMASQGASALLMTATKKAIAKLTPEVALPFEEQSESYKKRCGWVRFLQKAVQGKGLSRGGKFLHNQFSSLVGLETFMLMQAMLSPAVNWGWEAGVLNPILNSSRKKLLDQPNEQNLKKNSSLWEQYRARKIKDLTDLMGLHSQDIETFDIKANKPQVFYNWLMDGAPDHGNTWEALRDKYYSPTTKPSDIKKDTHDYLRGFFFGVEPKDAFHDSEDIHGVPIPGKMNIVVDPFRVTHSLSDDAKSLSDEELMKNLKEHQDDYHIPGIEAFANFEEQMAPYRKHRIAAYEAAQQEQLIKTLGKTEKGGILDSIQQQMSDVQKASAKTSDAKVKQLSSDEIDHLKKEQDTIQEVLKYYETPAGQTRTAPEGNGLQELLQAVDPDHQEDWVKAVNLYKGLIIQ